MCFGMLVFVFIYLPPVTYHLLPVSCYTHTMAISYTPLESDIATTFGKGASFSTGDAPSFFTTSSFLFTFAFVIIVVTASFRYAYAGMLRLPATQESIKKSKDEFTRVTYGLLGVFALWLILFTVNKDMLSGEVTLSGLKATPGTGTIGAVVPSTVNPNPGSNTYSQRVTDHSRVLGRLASSNIHTNHGDAPCTEGQFSETKPSCTSLAYLPEETIQLLLNLNGSCHCTIVITGGTEPGHVSHGEGLRPVDLRINASQDATDPLYAYIKGIGTPWPETSNCFIQYKWNSFTFCDEKPASNKHFHVS